jgi:uncharacterized membrane protein YczE/cytidylate kinase
MEDSSLPRSIPEHVLRFVILIVALFIMALGIAFSTRADLGISPISCTPYILSLVFTPTMGVITIIMHLVFVAIEAALLRRRFKLVYLLQIPIAFIFGFMIDFTLWLTSWVLPSNYIWCLVLCLLGCLFVGFGVFLQVKADAVLLAGEGMNLAFVKTFGWEFGIVKSFIDTSLVITGFISCLLFLPSITGIREGTVIAALIVGMIVRFFNRHIHWVDRLIDKVKTHASSSALAPIPSESLAPASDLGYGEHPPLVISIDREFGSGGHAIGEAIAKKLGISFYDSELVYLTAAKSGFTPDFIRKHEQQLVSSFLYELYAQNYAYTSDELPPQDATFLAQSKVIRDIASEHPCVIVGRCANFILKKRPNLFSIFLHADEESRKERIINNYGVQPDQANQKMASMDARRRNHCRYYTGQELGNACLYDLCIDTSFYGIEGATDLILQALQQRGFLPLPTPQAE